MFHKRNFGWIVIIVIISECILISGCIEQTPETGGDNNEYGFYTYEDADVGISIEYPVMWVKLEKPSSDVLVSFMPDEDNARRGEFNVSVFAYDSSDTELFWQTHTKELSQILTDFTILYRNSTILAGKKGYTQLFSFRDSGYTFKRMEIGIIAQGSVYLLSYQADSEYYAQCTDSVEQMIDSFEIKAEW